MIGQKRVRNMIGSYISNNSLPHFLILVGERGQGRRTLVNALAVKMNALVYLPEDLKVDSIRAILSDSVTLYTPKIYLLADAGEMTVQAQNALLKLAEEPPENAYIMLTVEHIDQLLPTIKSRATVVLLDGYQRSELEEFTDDTILLAVCQNPGQILEYEKLDYKGMYSHCEKVADNLHRISSANTFNILKNVLPEQYDLFITFLTSVLRDRMIAESDKSKTWYEIMQRVYKTKNLLTNKSINKANALEIMLLEMRDIAWQ